MMAAGDADGRHRDDDSSSDLSKPAFQLGDALASFNRDVLTPVTTRVANALEYITGGGGDTDGGGGGADTAASNGEARGGHSPVCTTPSGEDTASTASTISWVDELRAVRDSDNPGDAVVHADVRIPGHDAFTLRNVFSFAECDRLIELTERAGYERALINVGGGRQRLMRDVRNSWRHMRDDEALADLIWQRVKAFVPEQKRGCRAVGLNERLRFLKYTSSAGEKQYFKPHHDGVYMRPLGHPRAGDASRMTLLFYLKSGVRGGCTRFHVTRAAPGGRHAVDLVDVKPEAGLVLIHDHNILHEGCPTTGGTTKYVIRTDIMFEGRSARMRLNRQIVGGGPDRVAAANGAN